MSKYPPKDHPKPPVAPWGSHPLVLNGAAKAKPAAKDHILVAVLVMRNTQRDGKRTEIWPCLLDLPSGRPLGGPHEANVDE
ncbi:hypothetical protein V9T40_000517 [Parthenolecanium corni]|uniref:Uncharacterized protein n=1 Tax=Parthenolecanium corni TaxID=536013 RepID=A0AAN9TDH6_9HEMI